MNILVISDLHMDTGDAFGTFRWSEPDLILQIESIRAQHSIDKIILNGDIFELLKYNYTAITNAYPRLINYLRGRDFVFIKGNHDILNDFGVSSYQITNSSGQTIYIEHGHNADWLDGTKIGRKISRLGFKILKRMSKIKWLMRFYLHLVSIHERNNYIPKKYNTHKYLSYALRLLKEHDVVILGHTHKLEAHHTYYLSNKKKYINCGSCCLGRFEGVILDTETLKYDLIKEEKKENSKLHPLSYAG